VKKVLLLLFMLGFAGAAHAAVNENDGNVTKGASGLPVPRFASLRVGEVNMRTGPGTRYPIRWVYLRLGLPVEITAEYDIWMRVKDPDGAEGWIHKSALTGKRGAIVTGGVTGGLRELYDSASEKAPINAHLENGAVGHLLSCAPLWCKAKFGDVKGYVRKADFWGVYPNEVFD